MSKRQETLEIENALTIQTRKKRIYGCEEITIGFFNSGGGNEIVDFMTMDSKGILKCYEIKVTLQDLKSSAKKSWYGHYNYLVVSEELYAKVSHWEEYLPNGVGLLVGKDLESKVKAKKQTLSNDVEIMLKESMIRSMYWKMDKYKDAQNIEKQNKLKANIRTLQQERDRYYERATRAEMVIDDYEYYRFLNDGIDVDLKALVKEEKEKYRKIKKGNNH